ncbi:MAG: type IV pilus twitching motility protein PilT [Planctomycetota bacterium]
MEIHKLFRMMVKYDASDLHLKINQPPVFRVQGHLTRMQNTPPMVDRQVEALIGEVLSDKQVGILEERGYVDFSYYLEEVGRFRFNVFRQSGYLSAAIRRVQLVIPTMEELRLPQQIHQIAGFERGLVLVGGITGSGKSTTLASILDEINHKRRCHILTLEDPIEYLFQEDKAIINQREIGIDIDDFTEALRAAVRQDPDVILVGEMRDAETFETALRAAETGHLVLGTIHASSCAQTIGRVIDLFPTTKSDQIRTSMAFNLRGIINQTLLQDAQNPEKRLPAVESLFLTPVIRKLILDKEDTNVAEAMKQDKDYGCYTYNQVLQQLHKQGSITRATALKASPNPDELRIALQGIQIADGGII